MKEQRLSPRVLLMKLKNYQFMSERVVCQIFHLLEVPVGMKEFIKFLTKL